MMQIRGRSRSATAVLKRVLVATSLCLGGFIGSGALSPALAASPAHWQARVGAESADHAIQADLFMPKELWIDAGDDVTWTQNAGEIHTMSFLSGGPRPNLVVVGPNGPDLNPQVVLPSGGPSYNGTGYVNSGLMAQPGQKFALTFTAPGDFAYFCLVHPEMAGTVHVRPAGTPYPFTQAVYDAKARAAAAGALGAGRVLAAQGRALAKISQTGTNYRAVTAGIGKALGPDTSVAVMRFLPDTVTVRKGQTVVWTNRDPETPHTVTFGKEPPGGPLAAFFPSGTDRPGHATLAAPGQSINSGFLGAGQPPTFSVTFTAPGTYSYICALHDNLGMNGTVVVLP